MTQARLPTSVLFAFNILQAVDMLQQGLDVVRAR